MLPNIFLSAVCRYVLSRVTQMCPDASNVIMNGGGWAGLGWGWCVVAGGGCLTSEAVMVQQSTVARVSPPPPPRSLMPDAGPLAAAAPRQHPQAQPLPASRVRPAPAPAAPPRGCDVTSDDTPP